MMIDKEGLIYINGKECDYKYDRNEPHGVIPDPRGTPRCGFYKILKELFVGKYKITLSKSTEFHFNRDFIRIAFDPPPGEPK